jgi:SAM-dependent methyltransferase
LSEQRTINEAIWSASRPDTVAGYYADGGPRTVEAAVFDRHAAALSGRTLEIGVGAGRLTGRLLERARELVGIDISPAMVEHCRRRFPDARFEIGSLNDPQAAVGGGFDAIVAGYNLLDVVDHDERGAALDRWREILVPGGTLIMSTHNLAAKGQIARPGKILARQAYVIADNLRNWRTRMRNHRRLAPLEQRGDGWAIINDSGEEFSLLHHYISREAQERELRDHGFEPIECADLEGRVLGPGDAAAGSTELHYVARR